MASAQVEEHPRESFRVRPDHNPKSKKEKYKRVHYLVSRMGLSVSDLLQEALINLRRSAYKAPSPDLEELALKGYSDDEFVSAVKEILCIWLHQEAVDQGGEAAPPWLIGFLRLALGATDFLIPIPRAVDIFASYEPCEDMTGLSRQSALRACLALGFGDKAPLFIPAVIGLVTSTRGKRQAMLRDALTLPLEDIQGWRAS